MILAKGGMVNQIKKLYILTTNDVINDGPDESHYDKSECIRLTHELQCGAKTQYKLNSSCHEIG